MKPHLHPALINGPFGDPGLLIDFLYDRRALLFDLGDLSALPNSSLLKVSHVFVSHTHIDHFIGFDHLLRIVFGRGKTLYLYGPENFIANVEGKLAGFTWNLVDLYNQSITIEAVEVHEDCLLKATFKASDKFKRTNARREPFEDHILLDEPSLTVRAAVLEHRVPCLGFAVKEKFHVNVMKDRLDAGNFSPGSWLNELKQAIYEDRPDDFLIRAEVKGAAGNEFRDVALAELKRELVLISEGQKIGYVVDTIYSKVNNRRIVGLIKEADLFFCESPFIAEEEERARERCHLTSRQAGLLAREAGVKQLRTFHFSAKHSGRAEQLRQEAEEAFRG